ncbi:uncharacterized protein LOC110763361 isoform X1 [Prunus avium]|uniref:Uncharacterized protein LOC110763361 isoform X1 n=1 Tax=Prunus avium TaxID=42229 RepID=A0A6P5T407_PRUAV|nr:uncharacterized protein LOC110763361 isoform X1 [Prunus avium]XP_021821821.1 uncharacterized protein LOC110763361 isoform X1 [Prunus avium]
MWAQSLVATAMKQGNPFHGSKRAASVVSQKPNIPSVSTLQLPKLSKTNSITPSTQTQPLLSASSSSSSSYAIAPSVQHVKALRIRPTAKLGLLSLLFVLSMAFAALFSVVVICIPTINALRRLEAAVRKLSNVVSQEVPGTLSSLKLSGLEINELTQQLASLRKSISTSRWENDSK